jgi:hypothetical protein
MMNVSGGVSMAAAERGISERPHFLERTTYAILHESPSPEVELVWRDLLNRVNLPSHYTSPEVFKEPYFDGKHLFAILALQGNLATAVLVGIHEGRTVSCGLPTRPQIQIDPEYDVIASLVALMRGLEEESRGSELVSLYSWASTPLHGVGTYGYHQTMLEGVPILDLRQGPDALLKGCNSKRRNCIRYALKSKVEVVTASNPEEYKAFYGIYRDWCTVKRLPCYSYEIEGSVFRFFPGGLIEYSRNSSHPDYLHLKPNDILVWKAIEWACEQGFASLSMGGAHRFLREFGGSTMPIFRYRLDSTFLRRHDRKEAFVDFGRSYIRKLPPRWENTLRHIVGKDRPKGW